jgi:pSer/pThr/pTyr-binding forkhead associated (FHA) protein
VSQQPKPKLESIRPSVDSAKTIVDPRSRPLESPEKAVRPGESLLRVEVLTGPMDGFMHFCAKQELVIGRSSAADMILELDTRVSGAHARLFQDKGLIWLEDLGSTNGTFVGAERLTTKIPISAGVQFTVGRTLLEVLADQGGN